MGAAARTRSPSARHAGATPPRRQARHQLKPPAAFRIRASGAQLRRPGAAAIGHLHTDKTVSCGDRDRDRPAGSARPAVPDAVAEQLAHQQGGVIPARVPGTKHPDCERAGDPRPLRPPARPASVMLSRTTSPAISAPVLLRPHRPGGKPPGRRTDTRRCTLDSSACVKRSALSARPVRGCPWKADGAHRPSWRPDAVRYMSVDTATQRSTAIQGDT